MDGIKETVNLFEPMTAFDWNGSLHFPATPPHPLNPDAGGKEAVLISVPDEMVLLEIAKGMHKSTKKPISGLLNHCRAEKLTNKISKALDEFFNPESKSEKAAEKKPSGKKKSLFKKE